MAFFGIGLVSAFLFVLCLLWAIAGIVRGKDAVVPGFLAALSFTALIYAIFCAR